MLYNVDDVVTPSGYPSRHRDDLTEVFGKDKWLFLGLAAVDRTGASGNGVEPACTTEEGHTINRPPAVVRDIAVGNAFGVVGDVSLLGNNPELVTYSNVLVVDFFPFVKIDQN